MQLKINIPDELFKTSYLITNMRIEGDSVHFEGRPFDTQMHLRPEDGWFSGSMGFYTSDVNSMTIWERLTILNTIVQFAQKTDRNGNRLSGNAEYLVNVYKGILTVVYRERKTWG